MLRFSAKLDASELQIVERHRVAREEREKDRPGVGSSRPGRKKRLVGFSQCSRLNLAKDLAQVVSDDTPFHVCATYGERAPSCREDLDLEKKRIDEEGRRRGLYGYWVLEFQRARPGLVNEWGGMVPHWHILVWGSREAVASWEAWFRKHTCNQAVAAVQVREGDAAKAAWYLAMHSQKEGQSPKVPVGRWWGRINKSEVRKHQMQEVIAERIQAREVIWAKRIMRRMTGSRGSLGEQGFSWFLPEWLHARVLAVVEQLGRRPVCLHVRPEYVVVRSVKSGNHPF